MERSTTDVVSGALLAENAGAGLDEIEKVSNQIASARAEHLNTARASRQRRRRHGAQHGCAAGNQRTDGGEHRRNLGSDR